jgi:iron complex transport system permease protein
MTFRIPTVAGILLGLLFVTTAVHLQVGTQLPFVRIFELLNGAQPEQFADADFLFAGLPRAAVAICVGMALGASGSLMQQMTQNYLVSPMTLGAASGAWLFLVVGTLAFPAVVASYGEWVSLVGASCAVGLVVLITGLRGLIGIHAVLAGLAVNLLFGAVASTIIIIQSPYFQHLFVWGAGDLAQNGWDWVRWLLPRILPTLALAFISARVLEILRMGGEAAEGRGLKLWPFLSFIAAIALFLTAISVAAVGMIGFVGLLAPNIARGLGARRPMQELTISMLLGALLLSLADTVTVEVSKYLRDLLPSGTGMAIVGAPALIWLSRRAMRAQDQSVFRLPGGAASFGLKSKTTLIILSAIVPMLAIFLAPEATGWRFAVPNDLVWSFRWPRILTALAAGGGMAVSGVILQRLIRNPLASPDILGMSAGATFAMVGLAIVTGSSIHQANIGVAMIGSFSVLAFLIWLGRKSGFAPATITLIGIGLGALLDSFVKFALAAGGTEAFEILGWLAGSTYRVSQADAVLLAAGVLILFAVACALTRSLTLITAGDDIAAGRGLFLPFARPMMMVLAAAQAALITAVMGPVTFIGLIGPHVAALLGARKAGQQICVAFLVGALLLAFSDWIGRVLFYPYQLPAGDVGTLIGGGYFVYLLARGRRASSTQVSEKSTQIN